MSMNLYISVDGEELDLYQTPTYITEMCLMADDGFHYEVTGKDAMRAAKCYLTWVSSLMNGVYKSQEEYDKVTALINAHIRYVREAVANAKEIIASSY